MRKYLTAFFIAICILFIYLVMGNDSHIFVLNDNIEVYHNGQACGYYCEARKGEEIIIKTEDKDKFITELNSFSLKLILVILSLFLRHMTIIQLFH